MRKHEIGRGFLTLPRGHHSPQSSGSLQRFIEPLAAKEQPSPVDAVFESSARVALACCDLVVDPLRFAAPVRGSFLDRQPRLGFRNASLLELVRDQVGDGFEGRAFELDGRAGDAESGGRRAHDRWIPSPCVTPLPG